MKRRDFLKTSVFGAASLAALSFQKSFGGILSQRATAGMFVGVPVLPEYLYEQGIAKTLDAMQELAGINTVMTFSHDHVFRQYEPGFAPKRDHEGRALTGVWVKTDPKYYADPALQGKDFTAKYADRDILDELEEEARPRNMQVYARILEPYVITGIIPGFENWAEVNAAGESTDHVCYNHPEYIRYWESVINDLVIGHPYLNGFKFGQERGGPLLSALGKGRPGKCFCPYCLKLAKERGLDAEMARKGLIAVHEYGEQIRAGNDPVDGNFTTFLRIQADYPGLLAWEKFWMDSREEQRKRMFKQIRGINPNVQVGWHIDHGMTWDLITRATWDYADMGPYSDWLSVAVYFDSMGRRSLKHFEKNYKDILFGDADETTAYNMYLYMLGYDPKKEPTLEQHRQHDTSFNTEYVYEECKRAVAAVNGGANVYARPGFDMPGYDCDVTPKQVYQAVFAALDAGVDGLWCGREWDELKPENAQAFGDAIRDYKKKS